MAATPHHVVILGGGFGGLLTAQSLRKAPVRVTLVDRRNFHLFQPLLYQVATGGLSAANIATPLRSILRRQRNANVLLAEAVNFDLAGRRVLLSDGEISYDTLVVATGSTHSYFGHDEWRTLAPGLKSIEDATEIRRRVFLAFEAAEREQAPEITRQWMTFVIVGGGPTGVELAGALAEIARDTLEGQFDSINPADAKIIVVEGSPRLLMAYPPSLSAKAQQSLEQLGVTVHSTAKVTEVDSQGVTYHDGEGERRIAARTVLWGAGVHASPLGERLAGAAGFTVDHGGRVPVGPDLTLPGHPEVFVLGDLANFSRQDGEPLPGVAQVAMQEARYAAGVVRDRLRGRTTGPFRYRDMGTMATIGRNRAVAVVGRLKLSGYFAWLIWLFVHLMYIVEFENRMLIFLQWAWCYLTWNRPARLITGESPFPIVSKGEYNGSSGDPGNSTIGAPTVARMVESRLAARATVDGQ
jgi:NADH:ubiquinone reductase (H+-translocating)